jgi:hypothetical protein
MEKKINKMGAIIISLLLLISFIAIIFYLLFAKSMNSQCMGLFREKLLEALNQISVFSQSFETTTEEQVAFLKNPLIIPVRRHFHSFEAHCIRSQSPCFYFDYSCSTHSLLSSVIS